MNTSLEVLCLLNAVDGIARWTLSSGEEISELTSLDLGISETGLVESISLVFHELLESERILPSEISQINFILGPGSFTSLRTSLSFIQGLVAPNSTKSIGMSSFLVHLLSSKVPNIGETVLGTRANSQEYFIAEFTRNSSGTIFCTKPRSQSIEDQLLVEIIPDVLTSQSIFDANLAVRSLSKESIAALREAGHLYVSPGPCELMYIKGVSAKTLKERGLV